jgi:hypothetical protein
MLGLNKIRSSLSVYDYLFFYPKRILGWSGLCGFSLDRSVLGAPIGLSCLLLKFAHSLIVCLNWAEAVVALGMR